MLRRVALVRTDVSKELTATFIRVTRIGELGTTLAVARTRGTLRRNTKSLAACVGCKLQLALFPVHRFLSRWWRRRYVPPKRRFLQEPNGVTPQKMPFFIVTAVKTSNLMNPELFPLITFHDSPLIMKNAVVLNVSINARTFIFAAVWLPSLHSWNCYCLYSTLVLLWFIPVCVYLCSFLFACVYFLTAFRTNDSTNINK
jgi:hypothetical protein